MQTSDLWFWKLPLFIYPKPDLSEAGDKKTCHSTKIQDNVDSFPLT